MRFETADIVALSKRLKNELSDAQSDADGGNIGKLLEEVAADTVGYFARCVFDRRDTAVSELRENLRLLYLVPKSDASWQQWSGWELFSRLYFYIKGVNSEAYHRTTSIDPASEDI